MIVAVLQFVIVVAIVVFHLGIVIVVGLEYQLQVERAFDCWLVHGLLG